MDAPPRLFAVSDIHVTYKENRQLIEDLWPESASDWLLVAGDVGDRPSDVEWALWVLSSRFARVIWAPGNHELWTRPDDPVQLRGEQRYLHLVDICRSMGVATPEDPYLVWEGEGGPATIAPLFLLYDYTFYPEGADTKEAGLAQAYKAGIVCADENMLHPDPYPSREAWCEARVDFTERRLDEVDRSYPTILINHFPLVREPTRILRYPVFAQWCGTVRTADWHTRYRAAAVVYGHLHIPRTTEYDGVRFEEVSLGYPHEYQRWGGPRRFPRPILPPGPE